MPWPRRRARRTVPFSRIGTGVSSGCSDMASALAAGEGNSSMSVAATGASDVAAELGARVALTSGIIVSAGEVASGGRVALTLGTTKSTPGVATGDGGSVALTFGAPARGIATAAGSIVALMSGAAITVGSCATTAGVAAAIKFGTTCAGASEVFAGAANCSCCVEAGATGFGATGAGAKRIGSTGSSVGAVYPACAAGCVFRNGAGSPPERFARRAA